MQRKLAADACGTSKLLRQALWINSEAATHDGKDIVHVKVSSDRRIEGGGMVFLVKFMPP